MPIDSTFFEVERLLVFYALIVLVDFFVASLYDCLRSLPVKEKASLIDLKQISVYNRTHHIKARIVCRQPQEI